MTVEDGGHEVIGRTLVTFSISAHPADRATAARPVLVDPPAGLMKYRRPPATVSFDDLSGEGLPRVLFVNHYLPEGITVCGIDAFATTFEEAYHTPGALRMHPDLDEHGNEQCLGIGSAGTWEWGVIRPSRPHNGLLYVSARQAIYRVLIAPERDGARTCTALLGYAGHQPEDDGPVTFTISTRPDPAETATALGLTLTRLADQAPAAVGLLRLLAFLAPEPVPLGLLLAAEPAAGLPGPGATAVIGPLLGDQAAAGDAVTALRRSSLLTAAPGNASRVRGRTPLRNPDGGGRVLVRPQVREAVRAQLTAEEAAHWQQVAAAVVEAAVPADPRAPASWPACVTAAARPGHPEPDQRRHGPDRPVPRGQRQLPGRPGLVAPDRRRAHGT